ncbi:DNA-binding protein RFX7-like [Branchiostoma floridae]|uniref:DNA-binding protein RFX7-like n=1 Tax=Branchiostoma floridae TaxID=7739 RepID=A0A9J7KT61_BRAFL|nr:DNA-binding protein RFX7-like [Branchiostoma floridae]
MGRHRRARSDKSSPRLHPASERKKYGGRGGEFGPVHRYTGPEHSVSDTEHAETTGKYNQSTSSRQDLSHCGRCLIVLRLGEAAFVPEAATGGARKNEEFKPQNAQPSGIASRVEQTNALHWIRSHLEVHPDTSLPKQDVFDEYKTYCDNMKYRNLSPADFGKMMKMAFPNLKARRLGTRGNSKYCYGGLRKKSELQPPSFPSLDLPSKSDQINSSTSLLQSLSCPAEQNDDQIVSAASYLICEWAQGALKRSFDTVLDLARYLILNNVVSRASTAAFTVLHAGDKATTSPRAGSANGGASLKPLLSPSPFGKPLDAKQQLQRKIHRKQQAEQLRKLREEQGVPASQAAEQVTPPQTPTNQGASFQLPTNQVPVSPIKQTNQVAAVIIKVTNPVTASSMNLTNQVPASSIAQADKYETVTSAKPSGSGDENKHKTQDKGPTTSKKGDQDTGVSCPLNSAPKTQDASKASAEAVNSGKVSKGGKTATSSAAGQAKKTVAPGENKTVVNSATVVLQGISETSKTVSAGGVSPRDSLTLTVTSTTSSSQGKSSNSAFGKQAVKSGRKESPGKVTTQRTTPNVVVAPKGSIPTIAVTLPYIYKLVSPVVTTSSYSSTAPTTSLQLNAAVSSQKPLSTAVPVGTVLSTGTAPIIRVVSLATTGAPPASISSASGHLAALATRQVATNQKPGTAVVAIPQIYTTTSESTMAVPIATVTSSVAKATEVTMVTTPSLVSTTCKAKIAVSAASEKRPASEASSPAKRLAVSRVVEDRTQSNSSQNRQRTTPQSENTPQDSSPCIQMVASTQPRQGLPHNSPLQVVNVNTLVADSNRLPQDAQPSNQSNGGELKLSMPSQDLLSPNQEVRNIMQQPSHLSSKMASSNLSTQGNRSKGNTPLPEIAELVDYQYGSNLSHTNTPTPRSNLPSPCMEMEQAMRQQAPLAQDTMMAYTTLAQETQINIQLQQKVVQDAVDQVIQSTTPMSTPRATPTQGMGTPRATPTQEMLTPRHTPTCMSMSAPNSIPPSPVDQQEPFSFMPIQQNPVYDDGNMNINTSSPIKPMQRPRATHFNANNSNSNPEWADKQQGNTASSRQHPPPSYQETIAQRNGSNNSSNVQKLGGGSVFRNPNESAAVFRSPTNGQDNIQQIRQRFIQERLGQNRFSNHPAYTMRRNPHRNLSGGSNSSLTSPLVSPCSSRSITPVSPIMEHGNQMDASYGSLNQSTGSRIHLPQSPIYPSGHAGVSYPVQNRNRHRNLSGSILYSPHHQSSLSAQLRAYTQQMHQQQQHQQQQQAVPTDQQPPTTFRSQSVPLPELLNNIAGFNNYNQQVNVNQDYTNMPSQTNVGTYAAKRNLTELLEKESAQGYSDDPTYEDVSNALQANAGNYQENILQTDFQNGSQGQEEVQNQGYGVNQFGTQTWPSGGSGSTSPDLINEIAANLASMEEFSNLDSNSLFDPSKVPDSDTPSTLDDMTSLHDVGSFTEMCDDTGAQGCGGSVTGMDVMGGNGNFALTTSTGYGVQGW